MPFLDLLLTFLSKYDIILSLYSFSERERYVGEVLKDFRPTSFYLVDNISV